MDVQFLHPGFLWLGLAAPLFWFWPRGARGLAPVLRAVTFLLLVLAVARPVSWTEDAARAHHVLVVDASESTLASGAEAVLGRARDWRGGLPEGDLAHLVVLTDAHHVDGEARILGGAFDSAALLAPEAGLGAALAAASRSIPRAARGSVTLVSDGLSRSRRWAPEVQALQERGLPVHTLALGRDDVDVRPVALELLGEARVGHTLRVAVDLVGRAPGVRVRLETADARAVELARLPDFELDGRARVVLSFEPESAGFLTLRAVASATSGGDTRQDDDALETTIAVQDPLRVLYLGERVAGGAEGLRGLLGKGFDVAPPDVAEGGALPALSGFDLAVLDDRPARSVPEPWQQELVDAVAQRGLGLVATGGPAAFGPGGFHQSTLGGALPVEAVQKEEKRDPSTTLVVIIDTSGSMGGERVQLAKEVARLAIRRLLPHDKVGIVEFYGAKRWAAPIQPASNAIELQRALNRLDAGGGTVILPAIEEAFYGMQNVQTRYKHVLVLTDGGVETGAFEPLLRRMAEEGINVSTVLIGPEAHSEFLVDIANWGKGRFYNVPNRFNLPELVLKQPTSSKLPAYRPGAHPVRARGGAGWFGDVDTATLPDLSGYVETRARDGARVLIETERGAYPVLATWSYGLGRVSAFTTEPVGPGTESWRSWGDYGTLLARVLARTAGDARLPFAYRIERDGQVVTITAERLVREDLRPSLRIEGASGPVNPTGASWSERAPGVFEARRRVASDVALRALAGVAGQPERGMFRLVSPAAADVAPEHNVDPERGLDLDALTVATGGERLDAASFARSAPEAGGPASSLRMRELAPLAYLAALLLFLFELFWRRRPQAFSEVVA